MSVKDCSLESRRIPSCRVCQASPKRWANNQTQGKGGGQYTEGFGLIGVIHQLAQVGPHHSNVPTEEAIHQPSLGSQKQCWTHVSFLGAIGIPIDSPNGGFPMIQKCFFRHTSRELQGPQANSQPCQKWWAPLLIRLGQPAAPACGQPCLPACPTWPKRSSEKRKTLWLCQNSYWKWPIEIVDLAWFSYKRWWFSSSQTANCSFTRGWTMDFPIGWAFFVTCSPRRGSRSPPIRRPTETHPDSRAPSLATWKPCHPRRDSLDLCHENHNSSSFK